LGAWPELLYCGRFTPDGSELWVTVRGEGYVSVIDSARYQEKERIQVGNGPGMMIFRPDGKYGFVCSSFTPETEPEVFGLPADWKSGGEPILPGKCQGQNRKRKFSRNLFRKWRQ
jgi:YVTN family beta-propeller protein